MADRDELTLADMANDPNILRLTVRPEGVMAPPPDLTGWGAPGGTAGRPTGRLFEPDQSPAPRPTIGERLGVQPIEGWPSPTGVGAALGRGIGSLVQGAGTALSGMSRPPSDLTGGSRLSPGAGTPSSISGLPPRSAPPAPGPSLFERGARAIGGMIADIPQQIRQGYEHSATSLEGPPELREPARRGAVERATDVNLNLAGAGMAGASIRGGASAGVFGGRLAKGFDPNREKLAQQMETNGVPAQQIWRETGMVKFADGQWAHEIPDIGASYKGDVDSIAARIFDQKYPDRAGTYGQGVFRGNMARSDAAKIEALGKIQGQGQLYLPDVIDHPELFRAYPELRKMPVSQDAYMHAQGVYYPESIAGKDIQPRSIKYREETQPGKMARGKTLDTLLHEIQHAIQQIEGMAKGSNTHQMLSITPGTGANKIFLEEMSKFAKPLSEQEYLSKYPATTKKEYADYMDDYRKRLSAHEDFTQQYAAEQAYPRSAGENVAELPPQRKNMTPEQLRGVYPPNQFRVPMEQQFVEYNRLTNPADTTPQARMGSVLGLEGPQMSAGPNPLLRSPGRTMKEPAWQPVTPTPFLKDPQRTYSPGIYKNPKQIAEEAGAQTAKEHPALKELFGVTRDDLWQIGGKGTRQGNVDPQLWAPSKPGGSYVARNIMTPENAQRMIDPMVEARRFPALSKGMEAWYVMDPAFQRMVQLVGKEQAIKDYRRFNAIMTPFSSNSTVTGEINRGTAARMMADKGRFEEFAKYAGMPVEKRGADFPPDLRDVLPHLRHGGHIPPVERWLKTGEHGYAKETVKNPLYTLASGVPETGFQTKLPVPDAHLARASGAADVRTGTDPKGWGAYLGGTEYREFGPWFRENVAKPLGVEAVSGQGLMWGTFAPQTGVKTAIGAPKLEILSQLIWERAHKLGIDPKVLRDQVLRGDAHALRLIGMGGGAAAATTGMGSLVAPNRQEVY